MVNNEIKERRKEYQREYQREYQKAYRKRNLAEYKRYQKAWREKNRIDIARKMRIYQREYRKTNRSLIASKMHRRHLADPDKYIKVTLKWQKLNYSRYIRYQKWYREYVRLHGPIKKKVK